MVVGYDGDGIGSGVDTCTLCIRGCEVVRVERRYGDIERCTLGRTSLTATWAPGDTPVCTTWCTNTQDGGEDVVVNIFGCNDPNDGVRLLNNPRFPELIEQTRFGFDNLAKLNPDIYLTGHIEEPFEGIEQLMRVQTRPHPLLQQLPWQDLIAARRASIEARIEAERGAAR